MTFCYCWHDYCGLLIAMITKKSSLKNSIAKTILIILGIIVAALLTLNSDALLSTQGSIGINFQKLTAEKVDPKIESDSKSSQVDQIINVAGFIYRNLPSLGE